MVSNINGGLILVLPTYLLNLLCSYNNNNNNNITQCREKTSDVLSKGIRKFSSASVV